MNGTLLMQGIVLGFGIAAPVGPIGVLVIRRTLAEGRGIGLLAGLGAATADALFGAVGAVGATALASVLVAQGGWLRLGGALVLTWLGLRTLLATPDPAVAATVERGRGVRAFLSTFALTLTNPLTILSFTAIFAGFGLGVDGGLVQATTLVAGVWLGSALWWGLLVGAVSLLRTRLPERVLRGINVASGVLLLGFAALLVAGR